MPQRSGSVSVHTWLRWLRSPDGLPSTNGELANSAAATGCKRQADAELLHHVGFGLIVEIGLHRAGAQHHVEAEPALFRHVVAHDAVAPLRHPRDVLAPPFRVEAEPEHAEAELVADLAHLAQMLCTSSQVWCTVSSGAPGQLELAARLEGDRHCASLASAIDVAAFDHRLPAETRSCPAAGRRCRPARHRGPGADRSGGRRTSRARCRCARPRAASIPTRGIRPAGACR